MKIADLKGKKVTVFGLGLHGGGVDTVLFLVRHGARVVVTDIKSRADLKVSIDKLASVAKKVEFVLGQHRCEDFTHVDMVIKTPPAPWNNKHIVLALNAGVPVYVDASLFFLLCRQSTIGVTGTKGKTTTTSLIAHILREAKQAVAPAGIGQLPMLGVLDTMTKDSIPVCELSSWRLAALGRIKKSPAVSVVTNIMNDHGDYYRTRAQYEADKKHIISYQKSDEWCVLNADDETLRAWSGDVRGRVVWTSTKIVPDGQSVFVRDGRVYRSDGVATVEICSLVDSVLKGTHNQSNIAQAAAVAHIAGVSDAQISKAIATFTGVAHRLEYVDTVNGIDYVNDTAATIPDAAIASARAFTTPVVLIAGGADKNLQFADFAQMIATELRAVVFLAGAATDKIVIQLRKINPDFTPIIAKSMTEAVVEATKLAQNGDTVLLSPGAASFGLFANEFDRGDQFRETVQVSTVA